MLTAVVILIITYIGVAFTRLPKVNFDRPSAAFTGGVLMVLFGVLTYDEAIRAVDFTTIGLLLGMMILVSALKVTGFLDLLAIKSLSLATTVDIQRETGYIHLVCFPLAFSVGCVPLHPPYGTRDYAGQPSKPASKPWWKLW